MNKRKRWTFEVERGTLYDGTPKFFYWAQKHFDNHYGCSGPVDTLEEAFEHLERTKAQFEIKDRDIEWLGEYRPVRQLELFKEDKP